MALTQRLQIRQSQALVMTPQLMQAIKLLQLSNLDLAAYVEAELERNPLLERGAEHEPTASGATDGAAPDSPTADAEAPAGEGAANGPANSDSREEPLEDASLDEAARAFAPCRYAGRLFGMGRSCFRIPRRRRI